MKKIKVPKTIKDNFLAGIALLLPTFFTLALMYWVIDKVTIPFEYFIEYLLPAFIPNVLQIFFAKIAILLFLYLSISLIGFLGNRFLIYVVLRWADHLFENIPLINRIYTPLKQVIESILMSDLPKRTKVVLAPFSEYTNHSLGFVVGSKIDAFKEERQAVLVPGTPNPTMGFLLFYKKEHIKELPITVSSAIEVIVSCGIISDHLADQGSAQEEFEMLVDRQDTKELL